MAETLENQAFFWLAVAVFLFSVKHFLADFVLQNTWMTRGKEAALGWLLPLAAHAGIHAVMTAAIFLYLAPAYALYAFFADLLIHGSIDRLKASAVRRLALEPNNPAFWWSLGADQMAHNLTHLAFSIFIAFRF